VIFSQDRDTLRGMYRDAWRKRRDGEILSPLEAQIARVVEEHPEYQATVESDAPGETYTPEGGATNPYLHMGMHLAIREQVGTDRPPGIRAIFERIAAGIGDPLEAEHRMMEALGQTLWEAQRNNAPPDEAAYVDRLKHLG
jgi:hypothetical protein